MVLIDALIGVASQEKRSAISRQRSVASRGVSNCQTSYTRGAHERIESACVRPEPNQYTYYQYFVKGKKAVSLQRLAVRLSRPLALCFRLSSGVRDIFTTE